MNFFEADTDCYELRKGCSPFPTHERGSSEALWAGSQAVCDWNREGVWVTMFALIQRQGSELGDLSDQHLSQKPLHHQTVHRALIRSSAQLIFRVARGRAFQLYRGRRREQHLPVF